MRVSMTTFGLDLCHGEERTIEMLAESGFNAADLSLIGCMHADDPYNQKDYLQRARRIRALGESLGVTMNQTHSLYPVYKHNEEEFNATAYERLVRSIEITAELGAKHIIVHPFSLQYGDEWSRNIEFFASLTPYLKGTGVKVALENTFNYAPGRTKPQTTVGGGIINHGDETIPRRHFRRPGSTARDLLEMLNALDEDCFAACLDTGHSVLLHDEPDEAIRILGKRLECLHVHDNDGYLDLHHIPYDRNGSIYWDRVIGALREVGYAGDMTLESFNYVLSFPEELHVDALRLLAQTGKYLAKQLTQT